jgi:hypothetical protein
MLGDGALTFREFAMKEPVPLALRVRELKGGQDYRVFQVRKPSNRHLVDVRSVGTLPPAQRIEGN